MSKNRHACMIIGYIGYFIKGRNWQTLTQNCGKKVAGLTQAFHDHPQLVEMAKNIHIRQRSIIINISWGYLGFI